MLVLSTPAFGQGAWQAQQAIDDASAEYSQAVQEHDMLGEAIADLVDVMWQVIGQHGHHPGGQIEADLDHAGNVRQQAQNTLDDMADPLATVETGLDDAQQAHDDQNYWSATNIANAAAAAAGSLYNLFATAQQQVSQATELMRGYLW